MKLMIITEIPLLDDPDFESMPDWIFVRDGFVMEQKINLYEEQSMVKTLEWLEDNSAFYSGDLKVAVEDCIKFYWEKYE